MAVLYAAVSATADTPPPEAGVAVTVLAFVTAVPDLLLHAIGNSTTSVSAATPSQRDRIWNCIGTSLHERVILVCYVLLGAVAVPQGTVARPPRLLAMPTTGTGA